MSQHAISVQRLSAVIVVVALLSVASTVHAFQIINTTQPVRGDFVLEPAKIELQSAPGQSQIVTLRITNRDKSTRTFTVSTEDTAGSNDPSTPIVLLGDQRSRWTLRDELKPETLTFTLAAGQQMLLPVTVAIPATAEPGGRYASVIISNAAQHAAGSGSNTVARLTALFFVRIPGQANEAGALESFSVAAPHAFLSDQSPIPFDILFRNSGDVHLNPQGDITIKNIYGISVGDVRVDPFYAMPQSLRYRQVTWKHPFLLGRYAATLALDRGYSSSTDARSVTFWVLPWQPLAIAVAFPILLVALIVALVRYILSRFEIRRRS